MAGQPRLVIAANIAAGLAAWTRLLRFHDHQDLREADPDTLRRTWHIPARLARHARERTLKISPGWPWKDAFLTCWRRLCTLPTSGLTSTNHPANAKGGPSRRRRSRCAPGTPGTTTCPAASSKPTPGPKPGTSTISNQTSKVLND